MSGACRFRTAWECQRECTRSLAAAVQRDIAARQLSMESVTVEGNSSNDEGVRCDAHAIARQRDSIVMNARLLEALTTSMRDPSVFDGARIKVNARKTRCRPTGGTAFHSGGHRGVMSAVLKDAILVPRRGL